MTHSEEGPSTPLTVSSRSGTVDYCEENGDAVGYASGTVIEVDGEGRRPRPQTIADVEGDPATPSSRLPPAAAHTAAALGGGIVRAAVSVGAVAASGMAALVSTTAKSTSPQQAAAVPEEAGVPASEAFGGSGRLLGSKSKSSVYNLMALAAAHDDHEGDGDDKVVNDRGEGDPRVTSPPAAKAEGRRSGEAGVSARSSETLIAPTAPTTSGGGKALADSEERETSANPPRSASSFGDAKGPSPVGGGVEPTGERPMSITPRPNGSDPKDADQPGSERKDPNHKDPEHRNPKRRYVNKSKLLEDDGVDEDLALVPIDELNDYNDKDNGSDKYTMVSATPALGLTKLGKVKNFTLPAGSDGLDTLPPPPPPPPPPLPPPAAAAALRGIGANQDPSRDVASFAIGGDLNFPSYSTGRDGGSSVLAGVFGADDDSIQSGIKSVGDRVTEAAEVGDVRAIEAFIDRGGDLETRDSRLGATMLSWATRRGHLEVIQLLLARGARVMTRDSKRRTPLHRACTGCHADIVQVLLENRADPNARDMTGRTPLHRASRWGAPDCGLLLLDAGADIEARDEEMARTPLHYASRSGGIVTTIMLLDNGANPNAKTAVGNTALHLVCDRGLVDNAKILLEWGADPSLRNSTGVIPAEIAAPWVGESTKARLNELLTNSVHRGADGATIRQPTVVRSRPEGAAEVEDGLFGSRRSRRSSRNLQQPARTPLNNHQADFQRSRSVVKSTRDVFGELWSAEGSSRGASGVLSSSEVRLGSGLRAYSVQEEGGMPGLDVGRLDDEELDDYHNRSRRGLGSLRKLESQRKARAKKKKRQHVEAGGECHCTVQ